MLLFHTSHSIVTAVITSACRQQPSISSESRVTHSDIPWNYARSIFFIYLSGASMLVYSPNHEVSWRMWWGRRHSIVIVADCDILSNNRPSLSILLTIKLSEQAEWDSSSGTGQTTNWGIIKVNKLRGEKVLKDWWGFSTVHLLSLCRSGTAHNSLTLFTCHWVAPSGPFAASLSLQIGPYSPCWM